jgi:5-carboxymethyl-2-hydroxymuconate isomerase
MPFITIEMPDTLTFDLAPFVAKMHPLLSQNLDIPLEKLKTKLLLLPHVIVGHGDPAYTYANLRLELMAGRNKEVLQATAKTLLDMFKEALQEQNAGCKCRITCEFRELNPDLLFATVLS